MFCTLKLFKFSKKQWIDTVVVVCYNTISGIFVSEIYEKNWLVMQKGETIKSVPHKPSSSNITVHFVFILFKLPTIYILTDFVTVIDPLLERSWVRILVLLFIVGFGYFIFMNSYRPYWIFVPSGYESKGIINAPVSAKTLVHFIISHAID